jgi:hypothetical protein
VVKVCGLTGRVRFLGVTPGFSGDEAGDLPERETQNILPRTRCRQMNADHRLHLDDARGDLDEAQAQRVELGDAPHRMPGHRHAQAPHDPVGARVQEQPHLVGRGLRARGAVRRQMRFPGLDVIFGLAAPAVNILIEHTGIALLEIGDNEACVGSVRAHLDTGDDTLDAAPALGPVVELFEAAHLALLRPSLVARHRAGLQALDMPTQCRGRCDAQDVIEPVGATPVENLGTAIVTVAAQQYLGLRPVGADRSQQAAQEGAYLLAAGPFGRAKHGGDEAAGAVEHDDRLILRQAQDESHIHRNGH